MLFNFGETGFVIFSLNAEGAAAQEAQEQVGEAADDEPIPEVLADDGAGLLHDLPNNVVAALAELKKS